MKTNEDLQVYYSGDYAGMENGALKFYYGYEETRCKTHGDGGPPEGRQCECEDREWCFVAWMDEVEMARYTQKELETECSYASPKLSSSEPYAYLLLGIGKYIRKTL